MSKPFDATLKTMLEWGPSDWPALVGIPNTQATVIDADVSTVTAASDKVVRVRGNPDWLMDVNFQRGPDTSVPRRAFLYNAVLGHRHEMMVRSLVVLLTPKANLSNVTGVYEEQFPGEPSHVRFTYQVIRVWQLPTETLLAGGPGTLPLAPISAVNEKALPGVLSAMKERIRALPSPPDARELWTATYVLMGLKYDTALVNQLLREVITMEESSTYQYIIEQGMTRGALREIRKTILLQGSVKFGTAPPAIRQAIETVHDLDRLEAMSVRLMSALSWEELLES